MSVLVSLLVSHCKRVLYLLLCGFLVVSCAPVTLEAVPTASPSATDAPTATPLPTSTPTMTPTPTATAIPVLELGAFSAELKGKGVHGGMVCYTYDGDSQDLEGLTLTADISRAGNVMEKGIPAELIDGESCFELVDANYLSVDESDGTFIIPEQPLSARISAASDQRELSNSEQTIDLGKYVQFPFLEWIYPDVVNDVCIDNYHNWDGVKYAAWDFVPKLTEEYPTIVGTPVLAPVDGIAYVRINEREGELVKNVAFNIYSEDTGYLVNLTHNYELVPQDGRWFLISEFQEKEVSAGEQIGIISPKDYMSGMPHTHLQILIPPKPLDLSKEQSELNNLIKSYLTTLPMQNIDSITEGLFSDEDIQFKLDNKSITLAPCNYSWGEIVIPQQLGFTIDGRADDWADYTPVLTDKTGDSEAGSVMDLSELYMAQDDNYLYLMIKAGEKPGGEWKSWAVQLEMDLGVENLCGGTEWVLDNWTERPSGDLAFGGLDECDEDPGLQLYKGESNWGDVIEMKILLAYLRNPPEIDIFHVKSFLVESEGSYIIPDEMR